MDYATHDMRDNKEVVLASVIKYGDSIRFASEGLKDDIYGDEIPIHELPFREVNKDVALAAVNKYGYAIRHLSHSLKGCKEVALFASL